VLVSAVRADVILNFQGDNIGANAYKALMYMRIDAAGAAELTAGTFNYSGTPTGTVDTSYAAESLALGIGYGRFVTNTASGAFATITEQAQSRTHDSGVGVGASAGASTTWTSGDEGYYFTAGTGGLSAGTRLQITSFTVADFDGSDSAMCVNNSTGEYLTFTPDAGNAVKVLDVSSLNIIIDQGQVLTDPISGLSTGDAGDFSLFSYTTSNGWTLQSVSYNLIPEPASVSLFVISSAFVLGVKRWLF
jgi:hypothetical protein